MKNQQELLLGTGILALFLYTYFFGHKILNIFLKGIYYLIFETNESLWIKAGLFVIVSIILFAILFFLNDQKLE